MRSLRSICGRRDCIPICLSEIRERTRIRSTSCSTEGGRRSDRVSQFQPPPSGAEARCLFRRRAARCKSCPSRFRSRSAGYGLGATSDRAHFQKTLPHFQKTRDQLEVAAVPATSLRHREASAGSSAIMSLVLAWSLTDNEAIRGASDGDRSQVLTHERAQTDP
jgi:hypothetical protein